MMFDTETNVDVLRRAIVTNAETLSRAVDMITLQDASIVVLRRALQDAKRGCTRECTDRKCGTGDWTLCSCGAVEHNQKIDDVLKRTKE
jgi:hypothetical protein